MFPFVIPVLEGVASYLGFEIGEKLFGKTKTSNLPIPIKSKRSLKQKPSFPLATKNTKTNFPIKSKRKRKNDNIIEIKEIPNKPKKTLIDVLEHSGNVNSIMQSSMISTLARNAILFETVSSSLSTVAEAMEHFVEYFEYSKTPIELKDLEGNTITTKTPREIELIQRAIRAKLDSDENNLDIDDLVDDYESGFNILEEAEKLFNFEGITKDIKEISDGA